MLPSEKHREEAINYVRSLYDRPVMGYELAIAALAQHHTNPLKAIVQHSFSTVNIRRLPNQIGIYSFKRESGKIISFNSWLVYLF